jgi:hypothetical protein
MYSHQSKVAETRFDWISSEGDSHLLTGMSALTFAYLYLASVYTVYKRLGCL